MATDNPPLPRVAQSYFLPVASMMPIDYARSHAFRSDGHQQHDDGRPDRMDVAHMSRPPLVWLVIGLSFFALMFKVPLLLMLARSPMQTDPALSLQCYVVAGSLLLFFILLWMMCRWWIVPMALAYLIDLRAMLVAGEMEWLAALMPLVTSLVLVLHWQHFTWKPHWARITSS